MDHPHQEPLPPGIIPNFHPKYPFEWRQKLLRDPCPNELHSLGLPSAFSSYGRPQRGYGGYETCRDFCQEEKQIPEQQEQQKLEEYYEGLLLQQTHHEELSAQQRRFSTWQDSDQHQWQGQQQEWLGFSPHANGFQEGSLQLNSNSFPAQRRRPPRRGRHRDVRFLPNDRDGHLSAQNCRNHIASSASIVNGESPRKFHMNNGDRMAEEEAFYSGGFGISDEYAAYDDDPDWSGFDCGNGGISRKGNYSGGCTFGVPTPSSIDHYYNLAPQKPDGKQNNCTNNEGDRKLAIARRLQYLRRHFRDRVCEVCVVGFPWMEEYNKHMRSHVQCIYPGCKFEASIEVLDDHITREHLLNPSVNAPISDEEYRRQRRNKFPTQAKKELDQAMAALQKQRGELLGLKTSQFKKESNKNSALINTAVGNQNRGSKRGAPAENQRKFKKEKAENSNGKNFRKVRDEWEHKDTYIVYSPLPEFKGIDAFDEAMGGSTVLAESIQSENQQQDEVQFHISDEDEDFLQPSLPSDRTSMSASKCLVESVESQLATSRGSEEQNQVQDSPPTSVLVTSVHNPVCETPSVPESCALGSQGVGALGLLMGDYGSATESEGENLEEAEIVNHVTCFVEDRTSKLQAGDSSMRKQSEKFSNAGRIGETEQNVQEAVSVQSSKRTGRRRGRRGIKKRGSKPIPSDTDQSKIPFLASETTAFNSVSSVSRGALSQRDKPSLFPHLKPINVRNDSSSDEESSATISTEKSWHERSESALASRCISHKLRQFRNKYRTSLLEKLLKDEVRFERNVLLQCARKIVLSNFFEDQKIIPSNSNNGKEGDVTSNSDDHGETTSDDSDENVSDCNEDVSGQEACGDNTEKVTAAAVDRSVSEVNLFERNSLPE
ncbi:uncharacterized protein LOC108667085 [Hyalella azteca]|uniref:Uncharacterized protein LOC108667085 n=1 Tax=Hyalella azteca TaxID=294128 RepID=A0A8B7N6P7_HYAAZ|nr:uncharacterized protein LOC108667085 [Hyalella azteca]